MVKSRILQGTDCCGVCITWNTVSWSDGQILWWLEWLTGGLIEKVMKSCRGYKREGDKNTKGVMGRWFFPYFDGSCAVYDGVCWTQGSVVLMTSTL